MKTHVTLGLDDMLTNDPYQFLKFYSSHYENSWRYVFDPTTYWLPRNLNYERLLQSILIFLELIGFV